MLTFAASLCGYMSVDIDRYSFNILRMFFNRGYNFILLQLLWWCPSSVLMPYVGEEMYICIPIFAWKKKYSNYFRHWIACLKHTLLIPTCTSARGLALCMRDIRADRCTWWSEPAPQYYPTEKSLRP